MTDECARAAARWWRRRRLLLQRCSASALEVSEQARVGRNVSLAFVPLKAHERIKKATSSFLCDRLLQMTQFAHHIAGSGILRLIMEVT